jgi:diguanylate cyclase (GGDEF)-like protein
MAVKLILLLGALLLTCGSAGLLIVRLTNPRLQGLGWLGGAFAAGAVGALLLFFAPHMPVVVSILPADVVILSSFVLLQVAVLELAEDDHPFPYLGAMLILLQVAVDLYIILAAEHSYLRIIVPGLLVAAQSGQTANVLVHFAKRGLRGSAWFTALLLLLFMFVNILRSFAGVSYLFRAPTFFYYVTIATYAVFLAVALGIAFGFFWMTTAKLTTTLDEVASTDPLTRVYNRRAFLEWCEKEKERSERIGTTFSVLMIDLDHFKRINDNFGHRTGDSALCAVVEKMQDAIRGIDVIGRLGGEEFAVLLPSASPESALLVAQRVRGNIEKIAIPASSPGVEEVIPTINMTVSIGIASYLGAGDFIDDILHRADSALYRAKASGRNRVF